MAPSNNSAREVREARERLRRYNARQSVHTHQVKRRRRDNIIAIVGVLVVVTLATFTQIFYFTGGPGTPVPTPSASASATPAAGANVGDIPDPSVAEARTWTGTLTLNKVKLGIELDGAAAPQGVASVVNDAKTKDLVGLTCHRLVASASASLIQCGSTTGDGAGDADYSFGPIENAPADGVYPAGTIALARSGGDAYSQGHQFFITTTDTTLPADAVGGYTVVGTVTTGLSSLISGITDAGVEDGAEDGAPVTKTTITGLTVK